MKHKPTPELSIVINGHTLTREQAALVQEGMMDMASVVGSVLREQKRKNPILITQQERLDEIVSFLGDRATS